MVLAAACGLCRLTINEYLYVMSYCGVCVCVGFFYFLKTHRDGGVAPIPVGWPLGCSFYLGSFLFFNWLYIYI